MVLEYLPTSWDYFKLLNGVNWLVNIPAPWILWECLNHMGLSENSEPLHPMVLLIIIPIFYGYFIGGIPMDPLGIIENGHL